MSGRVSVSESDVLSDFIQLGTGRATLTITAGGSTYEIWAKHLAPANAQAIRLALPLQDGGRGTSSSTDDMYEVAGGIKYAIKRISGSTTVTMQGDTISL